jgi:phage gpG-like protein
MTAFLTVHVLGQPDLERKIQSLEAGMDTRAILDEGAALIFNRMRSRFLLEEDPNDSPWTRSMAAIRRERTGRGGGTLFDIGKLFRSLQLSAESATSRAIGTDARSKKGFPYPIVHQFGLAGFPRRQFLGFGDEDISLMTDVVIRHIIQELTK